MARVESDKYKVYFDNNESLPTNRTFNTGTRAVNQLTGRIEVWTGQRWIDELLWNGVWSEGSFDGSQSTWRGLLLSNSNYINASITSNQFIGPNLTRYATRYRPASSTINLVTGVRMSSAVSTRGADPSLVYTIAWGNTANAKAFHGFTSVTAEMTTGLSNPLGSGDSGIMFGFDQGSTMKVYYNDATGAPPTAIDTSFTPTAGAANAYKFGIQMDDTAAKVKWIIMDVTDNSILAQGELTSRIPAQTTGLTPHWFVENMSASQMNFYLSSVKLRQKA